MIWTMRRTPACVMGRRRVDLACSLQARSAAKLEMEGGLVEAGGSVAGRSGPGCVGSVPAWAGVAAAGRAGQGVGAALRTGAGVAAAGETGVGRAEAGRALVVGAGSADELAMMKGVRFQPDVENRGGGWPRGEGTEQQQQAAYARQEGETGRRRVWGSGLRSTRRVKHTPYNTRLHACVQPTNNRCARTVQRPLLHRSKCVVIGRGRPVGRRGGASAWAAAVRRVARSQCPCCCLPSHADSAASTAGSRLHRAGTRARAR